ncbi:MAG: T9SS type A sorting domain-containing protein, partial [Cyclobacteriaceae bacterium]|nr:T9SS type A sorting domain-containing protein [Cyclobacteriaceae bacterium]
QITLSATGGSPPYFYSIDGGIEYNALSHFTDIPPGDYELVARDQTGCISAKQTIRIKEPDPLQAHLLVEQAPSCSLSNGKVHINISGGTAPYQTYLTNAEGCITDPLKVAGGLYTLLISDANLCEWTEIVEVPEGKALDASVSIQSSSQCGLNNGIATVLIHQGIGPFDYLWSNGIQTQSNQTLPEGEGWVTIEDLSTKCGITQHFSIPSLPPLKVEQKALAADCQAANGSVGLTVQGGIPPYQYQWLHDPTNYTAQASGLESGIYVVKITDSKGCQQLFSAIVPSTKLFNDPDIAIKHPGCNQSNGYLSIAENPFQIYQGRWFDVSGNSYSGTSLENIPAGTYYYELSDLLGCKVIMEIPLAEASNVPLQIDILSITPEECNKNNGGISLQVSGGSPPYLYSTNHSGYSTKPPSNLPAGRYALSIRDKNSCSQSLSFEIPARETPVLCINSIEPSYCGQSNGSATVTVTEDYEVIWSTGFIGEHISSLNSGIYTAVGRSANGCMTDTLTLYINDRKPLDLSILSITHPTCSDTNDGTIEVEGQSLGNTFTYLWNDSLAQTGNKATHLKSGPYTVTVTDSLGCKMSKTILLQSPLPLSVRNEVVLPPVCHGECSGEGMLYIQGGTPPYSYLWSNGSTADHLIQVCPGNYKVQVTDSRGCTLQSWLTIPENPYNPQLNLPERVEICPGQTVQLDAGPWDAYHWWQGQSLLGQKQTIALSSDGKYILHVFDQNHCIYSDTIVINTNKELLQANFLLQSTAHRGDSVVSVDITWPDPDSLKWHYPDTATLLSSGKENLILQWSEAGNYTVSLEAWLGECYDEIHKTILILEQEEGNTGGRIAYNTLVNAHLYPNPNNGIFEISIELLNEGTVQVQLIDTKNNEILESKEYVGQKQYILPYDLSGFNKGMYLIYIKSGLSWKIIRFAVI